MRLGQEKAAKLRKDVVERKLCGRRQRIGETKLPHPLTDQRRAILGYNPFCERHPVCHACKRRKHGNLLDITRVNPALAAQHLDPFGVIAVLGHPQPTLVHGAIEGFDPLCAQRPPLLCQRSFSTRFGHIRRVAQGS